MFPPRPSCFWLTALISLCWVLGLSALRKDWKNFINKDLYKKYVGKADHQLNTNFFQGDISNVDRNTSEQQVLTAFSTIGDAKFRWPNATVPYTISTRFSDDEQMLITDAIMAISELTNDCVRFVEHTTEVDHLQIVHGLGCYSSGIGRQGGSQRVSLVTGCLEEFGDVQHEILHVLGFYHEHTRHDRDQYLTINWRNIHQNDKVQFQKLGILNFGLPYDYASVMHYPWNAFAMDSSLPTMVPKQQEAMIGQRANLSSIDIQRIRRAYGCDELDNNLQTGDMQTTLIPAITTTVNAVYSEDYQKSNENSNYGNKLRILTAASTGYVNVNTNGQLSGFIPDFLDILGHLANFTYTLTPQVDQVYGMLLPKNFGGRWNGMVGNLIDGHYDMIAADLSLNAARSRVIDFTTPYLTTQLRILVNTQWGTNNVNYLVMQGTAYVQFLQTSKSPTIMIMWANIQANNGFVSSTQEGVDKVLTGGFAFIGDIPTLNNALTANPTKLALTPDVLLSQFFAFGVQKGSRWRDPIGIAISETNESGQLQNLLDKYKLTVG